MGMMVDREQAYWRLEYDLVSPVADPTPGVPQEGEPVIPLARANSPLIDRSIDR